MTYYYPQISLDTLSDDEFAFWSENAQWVHSQMLMIQQTNTLGMVGGNGGQQ